MNVSECMKKLGLDDADLDRMADPYDFSEYVWPGGTIRSSSHLDAVAKRRATVVYEATSTQKVADIARSRSVKPSEVYRYAQDYYLVSLG